MRCKTVKSEVVKYVEGQGLVTEGTQDVEVNDPVKVHARWMDKAEKRSATLAKNEKDADHFAEKSIRTAYCTHCKGMCSQKPDLQSTTACRAACSNSAACVAGGIKTFHNDPVLDSYVKSVVTAADTAERAAQQKARNALEREKLIAAGERKAANLVEARIEAENKQELDALSQKQQAELKQVESTRAYSSASGYSSAAGADPAVLLALKHAQERTQLMMKQHGKTIDSLRGRLKQHEQKPHHAAKPEAGSAKLDAALVSAGKAGATVIHMPSTTVVTSTYVKPRKRGPPNEAEVKKIVKKAVRVKAADLKKAHEEKKKEGPSSDTNGIDTI